MYVTEKRFDLRKFRYINDLRKSDNEIFSMDFPDGSSSSRMNYPEAPVWRGYNNISSRPGCAEQRPIGGAGSAEQAIDAREVGIYFCGSGNN